MDLVRLAPNQAGEPRRWLCNMKLKLSIALVAGIAIGFTARTLVPKKELSVADHWQAVREYNAYMLDPSNYRPDPSTGLAVADDPFHIEPHLLALELAGEINHLDIVLPTVPKSKESTKHWITFCERHQKDIVFATGNPSWVAFRPKGTPPTHLNLWFTEATEPLIQQLIRELDAIAESAEPTR